MITSRKKITNSHNKEYVIVTLLNKKECHFQATD